MWDYSETGETIRRIPKDLIVPKKDLDFGAESSILIGVDRNTIRSPIEHGPHSGKGEPWAITRHGRPLTNRQQTLLNELPLRGSEAEVKKSDVSLMDLSALTAKTGVEFAMFTHGSKRLIVRGISNKVDVNRERALVLKAQGYTWSGHTHVDTLIESEGDLDILDAFDQKSSVIYNAEGRFRAFFRKYKEGQDDTDT
jgi:hypothetical protein